MRMGTGKMRFLFENYKLIYNGKFQYQILKALNRRKYFLCSFRQNSDNSDRLSYLLYESSWIAITRASKKYTIILTEVLNHLKELIN